MLFSLDLRGLDESPISFIECLKFNVRLSAGRNLAIIIEIKMTRSTGGLSPLSPSRNSYCILCTVTPG